MDLSTIMPERDVVAGYRCIEHEVVGPKCASTGIVGMSSHRLATFN